MRIFFVASPRSVNKEPDLYLKILAELSKRNKLLGENMIRGWVGGDINKFYNLSHKDSVDHYKKTIECAKKAEVVMVEATEHSMSMGYIVNKALENNKFVVVLHKVGCEPYFFDGIEDDRLIISDYTESNLATKINKALERVKGGVDVRFNFFVSPEILNYLDWVAKKRMLPRSVFLRDLIEREMKKDKEYEAES